MRFVPLLVASIVALLVVAPCVTGTPSTNVVARMLGITEVPESDVGGGSDCAACTIIIGLLEQKALIDQVPMEQVLDEICGYLPAGVVQDACTYLVNTYTPDILRLLKNDATGDEVCAGLHLCTAFPTCHLWPLPHHRPLLKMEDFPLSARTRAAWEEAAANPGDNPLDWLKDLINRVANLHEPLVDLDGDKFGVDSTLRGTSWRGGDCSDLNENVYPGRAATEHGPDVDHNCNGIKGVNSETGKSWEDELCGGEYAGQGLIVIGDSVGAHFDLPYTYFSASDLNGTTFHTKPDVLYRLENEFDKPYTSWGTGFVVSNLTDTPNMVSIYSLMLERNLCNHRDYQNTGVNGARSGAEANGGHPLVKDIARNPATDKPATVIVELVGNDVCNSHTDVASMTSVADFKANILTILNDLEAVLPPGSHVAFLGLARGTVLYELMHNRTHPIGVPYTSVYDILNCLQISPCAGWLNNNATIREATQAHALVSWLASLIEAGLNSNNLDDPPADAPAPSSPAKPPKNPYGSSSLLARSRRVGLAKRKRPDPQAAALASARALATKLFTQPLQSQPQSQLQPQPDDVSPAAKRHKRIDGSTATAAPPPPPTARAAVESFARGLVTQALVDKDSLFATWALCEPRAADPPRTLPRTPRRRNNNSKLTRS